MSLTTYQNTIIGEYRLVDLLGSGGMAEVYRAVHVKTGRVVAIKILTNEINDPNYAERFVNEARLLAHLQHMNIARLYEFIEYKSAPCIIMEYVDGETLHDRIRSRGALPPSESIFIFQSIVEAIDHIHEHGIVHRDIKPTNIKISSDGEVKLLDFGIAKSDSTPKVTVAGGVVGTTHYLSPERIRGKLSDNRSDIWALGVLFYEMIVGRVPFDASNIEDLYENILKRTFTLPLKINPSIPIEFETVISRCLQKKASDRYQSSKELLHDVHNCAEVVSSFKSTSNRRQKMKARSFTWLRSRKLLVLAVMSVILLLVYFIFWGSDGIMIPRGTNEFGTFQVIEIGVENGPANIFINEEWVTMITSETPYKLPAKIGEEYRITLKRRGYHEKSGKIKVNKSKNEYVFTLEKIQ